MRISMINQVAIPQEYREYRESPGRSAPRKLLFIVAVVLIVAVLYLAVGSFFFPVKETPSCGDGVCDPGENCYDCAKDCRCDTGKTCSHE